jgi:transposase
MRTGIQDIILDILLCHDGERSWMQNAGAHLLPEAEATQERRLEAVRCSARLCKNAMFWETIALLTPTRNCFALSEFCTFMGFIHGANRHEALLFPERLDDSIAAENPVRFLDAFVDHLNLTTLGFQRATPAATGRPAYDPADLLQLYIYGYLYRLRSRRRLEQETHRTVEFMWRLKKLRPDHKTMADFRKNHLQPLRQVCREVTLLCKQLDLFAGALVASDGSKCKAVNAKEGNFTQAKLTHLRQQIDQRVEGSRKDLDGQDTQEEAGTPGGAVADNVQEQLAALQHRQLRYAGVQAQ